MNLQKSEKDLENEREKDRELERYRLQMKDRENQRRYNLDVLRYRAAQNEGGSTLAMQLENGQGAKHLRRESPQMRFYSKLPSLAEQQNFETKQIDYVLHHNGLGVGTSLYND